MWIKESDLIAFSMTTLFCRLYTYDFQMKNQKRVVWQLLISNANISTFVQFWPQTTSFFFYVPFINVSTKYIYVLHCIFLQLIHASVRSESSIWIWMRVLCGGTFFIIAKTERIKCVHCKVKSFFIRFFFLLFQISPKRLNLFWTFNLKLCKRWLEMQQI